MISVLLRFPDDNLVYHVQYNPSGTLCSLRVFSISPCALFWLYDNFYTAKGCPLPPFITQLFQFFYAKKTWDESRSVVLKFLFFLCSPLTSVRHPSPSPWNYIPANVPENLSCLPFSDSQPSPPIHLYPFPSVHYVPRDKTTMRPSLFPKLFAYTFPLEPTLSP